jgi:chlorobactene glucosyltransferase
MLVDILFGVLVGFLVIRLVVSLANLLTRPRLVQGTLRETPKVSVLVPARNEGDNLPSLLQSLERQGYPHLEVLVLDDQSTDDTAAVVLAHAKHHHGVQLLSGAPLPAGWLGKNWACHQLAQAATGEYLLFLDADVQLHQGAIAAALAEAQAHKLQLLSLFPDQVMRSTGERTVVPIMHYLLVTMLPLRLVQRSARSSLAAANGQFMLFEAKAYRHHHWHERKKASIVEDIAIMRGLKSKGEKGSVLLANGFVSCRMYQGYAEGVRGFSKNLLAGFNDSMWVMGAFLALTVLGPLALLPWLSLWQMLTLLLLTLALRLAQSLASAQSAITNLLLHPFQMGTLVWVGIRSSIQKMTGKRNWKGRLVDL